MGVNTEFAYKISVFLQYIKQVCIFSEYFFKKNLKMVEKMNKKL